MAPLHENKVDQQCPASNSHPEMAFTEPFTRKKRSTSRISSSPTRLEEMMEPIDVKGQAILCFDEDMSWFNGTIVTNDASNYSISGGTCDIEIPENFMCDCDYSSPFKDSEGAVVTFNVRLNDHDTPMEDYCIPQVHAIKTESSVSFCCSSFSFSADKVYRGQRAALIANQSLGNNSRMGGKICVLCGPITILATSITENKKWLL